MRTFRSINSVFFIILCVAVVGGLGWATYQFSNLKIGGDGFFVQWTSLRSFLTVGNSPYSAETTALLKNEELHENTFSRTGTTKFTSPIFSWTVVFPFVFTDSRILAHALWMSVQFALIFIFLLVALKLSNWSPPWYIFVLFSLLTLFSFHTVIPWLDGSMALWVAFFLIMTFLAIQQNRDELGGICLGLSMLQPQVHILLVIFILYWMISRRRRVFIFWFVISILLMSIIGVFLVQDWILQYLRLLYRFADNFPAGTLASLFHELFPGFGSQLGWVVTGISAILLLAEWWTARGKDFRWFMWTGCLTLVISQWIGIPTTPANYFLLILPLILVCAYLAERWRAAGNWVSVIIALGLFIWEWALYYFSVFSEPPANPLDLIIPLPLVLLIGMYWVRWWAIRPRRMLMEELRYGEHL